jgi:hypothetical protein
MANNPSTFLDGLLTVLPENNGVDGTPRMRWNLLPSSGLTFTDNPTAVNPDGTLGRVDISGTGGGSASFDLVQVGNNADVTVTSATKNVTVIMKSLSANRNVTLPAGVDGQTIIIKARADGSLGAHNIVINSSGGATIENAASPFTMTPGTFGDGGSIVLKFSSSLSEWERVG